ncbi:hypothetical protein EVG20_g7918 [Dentipellis fragilis]|uniref:ZZ-type domain-containing protein n=1 Tax=Dentipellis fragilis TaxID=205917 RepID=A0A4Y9YDX0_9AGAM|nr:hypothetical protein EVG20_g7918 [Dentipellis fragilis]
MKAKERRPHVQGVAMTQKPEGQRSGNSVIVKECTALIGVCGKATFINQGPCSLRHNKADLFSLRRSGTSIAMLRKKPQHLDQKLTEAAALIDSSDPSKRKISKTERFLNKSGDLISTVSGTAAANAGLEKGASAIISTLKLESSNFVQSSKALVSALDEVAKLHPFVGAAVLVFTTAVNLLIKRRENDGKVLVLNVQMRDMMSTLLMLKRLTKPEASAEAQNEITIESRLGGRMSAMVDSMKDCSKVCDSYNKNRVVLKILTSSKWEQKFAAISKQFATHSAKLQDDLAMYSSIGINAANKSLAALSDKMDEVMATVFKTFQSAEERQIGALVASKGGPEKVAGDNAALEQLLYKQKELDDGPGKKNHAGEMTVSDLRKDMRKDVQVVLDENSRTFNQKFELQQRQIAEEMKNAVFDARDDIINAVLAGPYERVEDEDMRAIWKEMGWKGSVKARHLVLAMHDYFTEQRKMASPASEGQLSLKMATESDEWTLEYISINRIQPLIEALDDDVSSFVTIAEVNAFTRARPDGWSLPYWIAYNTIGVELSFNYYYHRINQMHLATFEASKRTLIANRKVVNDFLCSPYIAGMDQIMSGIQDSVTERSFDWDSDTLFLKFKPYIVGEEKRIRDVLESLDFNIDDESTLRLISDTSRPEKYFLPILCILLDHCLYGVEDASRIVLPKDRLSSIDESLGTLWTAISNRAESLNAIFKLQNLNSGDQMSRYCFGMYRYVLDDSTFEDSFWQQDADIVDTIGQGSDSDSDSDSDAASDADAQALEPADADELDLEADPPACGVEDKSVSACDSKPATDEFPVYRSPLSMIIPTREVGILDINSIEGVWSGRFYQDEESEPDNPFALTISLAEPDGSFVGSGTDILGDFMLKGRMDQDDGLSFTKTYTSGVFLDELHQGTINESFDEVHGQYRASNATASELFFMKRKPLVYILLRPADEEFDSNKTLALWKFALDSAMYIARIRVFTWKNIRERRDARRRFMELEFKNESFSGLDPDEEAELRHIHANTAPQDLCYWNAIVKFMGSRRILHSTGCNNCDKWPIEPTRMACLQCSSYNSADFCAGCFDNAILVEGPTKMHHSLSHNAMLLRIPIPFRYDQSVRAKARSVLSAAQDQLQSLDGQGLLSPTTPGGVKSARLPVENICVSCSKSLSPPFWCCMACEEGPALLCLDCNDDVEKEKPWLFERAPPSQAHNWSHPLVLIRPLQIETPEFSTHERLQGIEDAVDSLEGKIQVVENAIATRFQAMERLIMEIIDGTSSRNQYRVGL